MTAAAITEADLFTKSEKSDFKTKAIIATEALKITVDTSSSRPKSVMNLMINYSI